MAENRGRLDSWKEIAEYIGRDARTAIRWERERGLPVRRVPGQKRSAVFAFKDEIDSWLLTSSAPPGTHGRDGPDEMSPADGSEPARRASHRRVARLVLGGGLSVLLLGLALRGQVSGKRPDQATSIGAITLAGTELKALGADHQVLWQHDFGREVEPLEDSRIGQTPTVFSASDDLDGDGQPDLLVSVPFRHGHAPTAHAWAELFAFSARGRVLWSHRIETRLTFGAGEFVPPWHNAGGYPGSVGPQIAVFDVRGRKRVAWAQSHHTWWPSILTVLDTSGHPLSQWIHSGEIYTVAPLASAADPLLLVGGVSNSREAAFLAVLDAGQPEGSGPEEPGSPFECLTCGPGRPQRYFIFTPSDVVLATGPYNHVVDVPADAAGFEVRTVESPYGSPYSVQGIFRFSNDFVLRHAAWSSAWAQRHRQLERAGRLDHETDRCPDGDPRVREWTPDAGWRDILRPQ